MRKDIHPKLHKLELKISDDKFETMSTSAVGVYFVERDFRKHPAWVGKGVLAADDKSKNISSFNKKFSEINFGTSLPKE